MFTFSEHIHFFPKTDVLLKLSEQRIIKINVPFIDVISGLAVIILLDLTTGSTNTVKVKFWRNTGYHNVIYNSSESLISSDDEALSTLSLRSIGYYKVK